MGWIFLDIRNSPVTRVLCLFSHSRDKRSSDRQFIFTSSLVMSCERKYRAGDWIYPTLSRIGEIRSADSGPRTESLREAFLISSADSYANKYALYGSKRLRVRSCFRCNPKLSGLRDQRRINRPSENRLEISCVRTGGGTERARRRARTRTRHEEERRTSGKVGGRQGNEERRSRDRETGGRERRVERGTRTRKHRGQTRRGKAREGWQKDGMKN